jgi:hypothetical protein
MLHCGAVPNPVAGVVFYDSATGAVRAEHVAPATGTREIFALTDTAHGVTYLIDPSGVTTFSDATGQQTGTYTSQLSADADHALQSVALDEQLGLIYALDSNDNLTAYTAADGQQVASVTLPSTSLPQLLVDENENTHRLYVFSTGGDQPATLTAYYASDLGPLGSPLGSWLIPQGKGGDFTAGPLDAATHTLYLWGPSPAGSTTAVWTLDLDTLPASGAGQTVIPQEVPELAGAVSLGFDGALPLLATRAGDVAALAPRTFQPYAGLPLVQASEPAGLPLMQASDPFAYSAAPLPIDSNARLAYLPGADNTLLIVSLARPASYAAPNAATAELIARAGMAKLLPDTHQDPPFVSAQTFPLGAGSVTRQYFIHYSDLGWKGPYSGGASVGSVKAGAAPGDYTMTFTISWNQLFLRQHSWTVEVTPDGRTHLRGESGDAIP